MKTTIPKKNRITTITFNEADPTIRIETYNTALKKRLLHYSSRHPAECQLLQDQTDGCLTFTMRKGRFGFRLTSPYDDKRRSCAQVLAKRNLKKIHPPA